MIKFIRVSKFAGLLFTNPKQACHASEILAGIIAAQSPRLSDIATHTPGHSAASYKRIQRFLQEDDPRAPLKMLYNAEADFAIGDPTEIERPHATKTGYVGALMDGRCRYHVCHPFEHGQQATSLLR